MYHVTPYITTDNETYIRFEFPEKEPDVSKFEDKYYLISRIAYQSNILFDILEDILKDSYSPPFIDITPSSLWIMRYNFLPRDIHVTLKKLMPVFGYDDVTLFSTSNKV